MDLPGSEQEKLETKLQVSPLFSPLLLVDHNSALDPQEIALIQSLHLETPEKSCYFPFFWYMVTLENGLQLLYGKTWKRFSVHNCAMLHFPASRRPNISLNQEAQNP